MQLGYVSVNLDKGIETDLINSLFKLGLKPIYKYPYHCTLMYDETECSEPRTDFDPTKVFKATVQGIEVLGDAVAFTMTSKDFLDEHSRLKAAGYTHSFPALKVHMSLIYDFTPLEYQLLKQGIGDWVGKELTFSELTVADCE